MDEKDFYRYALNKDNYLVSIYDVTEEHRHDGYKCIACNGKMEVALGKVREHYFRHSNKIDTCSYESYIHNLWKYHVKNMWDSQKHFIVGYRVTNHCDRKEECEIKAKLEHPPCDISTIKTLDLKKLYNSCKIERYYDKYKPDVILLNTKHPKLIKPTFIEINYKHPCEEEKKKSGNAIIELKVFNDELSSSPLIEEQNPNVQFYGVNREPDFIERNAIKKYFVYRDDKAILRMGEKTVSCWNAYINACYNSLFEIILCTQDCKLYPNKDFFIEAMKYLYKKRYPFRHCCICRHYGKKSYCKKSMLELPIRERYINTDPLSTSKNRCKNFTLINNTNSIFTANAIWFRISSNEPID